MDFEKGQTVNVHGFRASWVLEPEVENANATGLWAVWVLPGGVIQNSDLPQTFGDFGNEDFAPYFWGMGSWVATNQTGGMIEFALKSTRNIQSGGRIVFEILVGGLTSGAIRHRGVLTCFTTPVS